MKMVLFEDRGIEMFKYSSKILLVLLSVDYINITNSFPYIQ